VCVTIFRYLIKIFIFIIIFLLICIFSVAAGATDAVLFKNSFLM